MKRKPDQNLLLNDETSAEPLVEAAFRAKIAAEEKRQSLSAGCFHDLSECTSSSGIPHRLDAQIEQELHALRSAATELESAHRAVANMADELQARRRDTRQAVVRRWYQPNPPANSMIDRQEQNKRHFAAGMSFYKLALVFIIGSFVGVVVETLWCLLRHGYFESRNGVLWGPFSPLYGLGAVVLTLTLYRFRNRGKWLSFVGGFIVGTVVEYVCSWWQEWAFGSKSWDYSAMPFNINGRVCLLYSIFWGVLGVLWIKDLYPRMSKWILRLPHKPGVVLTWILTIFMIINCAVSGLAVLRWSERVQGFQAENSYETFMDAHFPDERMESIWANMDFGVEDAETQVEDLP